MVATVHSEERKENLPVPVVIVGAGGFGRELLSWLAIDNARSEVPVFDVQGFIDDDLDGLRGYSCDVPILASIAACIPDPRVLYLMALGDPTAKLKVACDLKSRGARFLTYVHSSAIVGQRVSLGEGTVVCPYAVLTCDIRVGDFVTVNVHASVGHDAVIGDGATLSAHCDVTGFASLGKAVFLGSHACVAPKVVVGDQARIGAGTALLTKGKAGATYVGVPARRLI